MYFQRNYLFLCCNEGWEFRRDYHHAETWTGSDFNSTTRGFPFLYHKQDKDSHSVEQEQTAPLQEFKQSCGERPYWAEPVLLCWTCLCPAVLSWKSASPHTVTQHIKAFYHKTKPSFSCAAWFCLFMLSSVIISARSKLRQRNWPTGTINMSIRQRSVASFVSVVQSRSQDMTLCWKSENHWGSNSSLIVTVCQSTWHFFSCGCFFTISPTNCTRTSVCAERKTAFCWLLHIVGQLILTQS